VASGDVMELFRDLWPYVLAVTAAVAAVGASLHAITTKRTTGSALAWVGLVWLSPLFGAILYLLLGINRVHRQASEARAGAVRYRESWRLAPEASDMMVEERGEAYRHLGELARLGDRVAERPLLPGNRVETLAGGQSAYPAMLAAIDAARESVSLATYIFDFDRAGRSFVEALQRAVSRGVAVRVLIDDVGARYSRPTTSVAALRRAGVPVARFMPAILHWKMPYFNLRNHRKILVVDGRVGFTGGMNIREGHDLRLEPKHPTPDTHFRVTGPVVAEMQEVFAEDWSFATRERLAGSAWFPELERAGEMLVRGVNDGPDVDFERLQSVILGALTAARHHVTVMTPYFIPDQVMSASLTLAAMRGVEVRICVPEKSNLQLVQWASTAHWAPLLEKGCRIFLVPPPFDHSKLMMVDDAWSLIGSANLDPRSLQLNFEFNLECYDAELSTSLRRMVEEKLDGSTEVSLERLRNRPFRWQLRDNLARLLSPFL
jgi:cardiolipin synthase A/B